MNDKYYYKQEAGIFVVYKAAAFPIFLAGYNLETKAKGLTQELNDLSTQLATATKRIEELEASQRHYFKFDRDPLIKECTEAEKFIHEQRQAIAELTDALEEYELLLRVAPIKVYGALGCCIDDIEGLRKKGQELIAKTKNKEM